MTSVAVRSDGDGGYNVQFDGDIDARMIILPEHGKRLTFSDGTVIQFRRSGDVWKALLLRKGDLCDQMGAYPGSYTVMFHQGLRWVFGCDKFAEILASEATKARLSSTFVTAGGEVAESKGRLA